MSSNQNILFTANILIFEYICEFSIVCALEAKQYKSPSPSFGLRILWLPRTKGRYQFSLKTHQPSYILCLYLSLQKLYVTVKDTRPRTVQRQAASW